MQMLPFAVLFSKRVWQRVLVVGAILAPGKRTVSAILHLMGLEQESYFPTYHRVLNRAVWSSRKASGLLLKQLVQVFAPTGVVVLGIDDTIEPRWGKRIAARGIYRDALKHCCVRHIHVPLQYLCHLPVTDWVGTIPVYAFEDDVYFVVTPLKQVGLGQLRRK